YSTFLQRAYDQVVHDICRQNLNVVFAIDRAGLVGADGETHQGVYDIAFLRHIPNMVIMMPKDEQELRNMMKTAVDYDQGPIAVRYPRVQGTGAPVDAPLVPIEIGTWETLREGDYAAVIAIGPMVQAAEEAADLLRREGLNVRVINARFVKPLDETMLLALAKEHMPLFVLEEGSIQGGLGSAIMEFYAQNNVQNVQVHLAGVPDLFVEHASIKEQRAQCGLTAEAVARQLSTLAVRQRQRAT
ncbi:MAG: 1-deoxy-D-xylulose-5-phosphate synthase, partial [Cohnella sp.]|nr:1-deoxy-D-xylulose-5-phosphate synthase [Cohnella sp.]